LYILVVRALMVFGSIFEVLEVYVLTGGLPRAPFSCLSETCSNIHPESSKFEIMIPEPLQNAVKFQQGQLSCELTLEIDTANIGIQPTSAN
jgi:hypothetical protein